MTVVKPDVHDFSAACSSSGVLRRKDAMSRMPELQRRLIKLLSARQRRIPACVARSRLPQLRSHPFISRNPSVAHVRHAVALDERRRMFRALAWLEGEEHRPRRFQDDTAMAQDAREVWFTGGHADIGGGWPERVSGLAKVPLLWMIEETSSLGIEYVTRKVNRVARGAHSGQPYVAPDPFATVNESLTPGWKLLEYLPLPTRGEGLRLKLGRARLRTVWA
jgi:hypothetical protein